MKKRILPALFATLALLLVSCELKAPGHGRAVVLSVALDYTDAPAVQNLPGTIADAREFTAAYSSALQSRGVSVTSWCMLQEGSDADSGSALYPTEANIYAKLDEIAADLTKDDMLVFFYSGHGGTDDNGKTGFLVTAPSADSPLYGIFDMATLYEYMERLPCTVLMIVDACYSGVLNNNADEPDIDYISQWSTFLRAREYNKTVTLAASQNTETSFVSATGTVEGGIERHGLFTIALLECMGWVHSSEIKTTVAINGIMENVNGYLDAARSPGALTVSDAYDAIMRSWSTGTQTPDLNVSFYDIYLIP